MLCKLLIERIIMKRLTIAMLIASIALMMGCGNDSGEAAPSGSQSSSGAAAVDEFLDSYEAIIEGYEEMVASGALAGDDLLVMIRAVNEMNERNLKTSHKAEDLKVDERWTNAQEMRLMRLSGRFSEAMMKMSHQINQ
jgi:hypothetical protein